MTQDAGNDSQPTTSQDGDVSLLSVANTLLLRRRLIIGVAFFCTATTALALLLRDRTYTSSATFVSRAAKGSSDLGGLAAQFGVSVPGADPETSPAFYVDLVSSRAILSRVVDTVLVVRNAGSASVADWFKLSETNALLRREDAITRLGKVVQSGFSQKTGVVTVSVTAKQAELAQALVDRIISTVSRFNLTNQQSRAAAERRFTEQRMGEALTELHQAEARAAEFLQRNREYRNAPQLALEFDRLTRDIGLRQQLYNSLAQAYDKVKIDEARDTPNITLINHAEIPVRPDPRGLLRWATVAFLGGTFLGGALALLLNYLSVREEDEDAFQTFAALRTDVLNDLRRPWRLLKPGRD